MPPQQKWKKKKSYKNFGPVSKAPMQRWNCTLTQWLGTQPNHFSSLLPLLEWPASTENLEVWNLHASILCIYSFFHIWKSHCLVSYLCRLGPLSCFSVSILVAMALLFLGLRSCKLWWNMNELRLTNAAKELMFWDESNLSRNWIFFRLEHAGNLAHLRPLISIWIHTPQSSQKNSLQFTNWWLSLYIWIYHLFWPFAPYHHL